MLTRRVLAIFILLVAAAAVHAQQPQLLRVFPAGAQVGETVEVTLFGHDLDGSEKLLFSRKDIKAELVGPATTLKKAQPGQPTSSVLFKVTAPKGTDGMHDVRVVTQNGISNPRAFVVSEMTEVNEKEPNNDVGQAQKIELETSMHGVISSPTDVDYVVFKAKKDQNIVVYCLTTSIDSRLQAEIMVSGPDGKKLASNRGYRDGDAVLDFKAPTDGDYFVRVCQFAYTTGGFDHFYRLTVTTTDWVEAVFPPLVRALQKPYTRKGVGIEMLGAYRLDTESGLASERHIPPTAAMIDAVALPPNMPGAGLLLNGPEKGIIRDNEKNTTADTAQSVEVPCDIAGRIAKKNERHWYKFDAKKGEVWTLEVFAERIGSPVDAYFVLTDDKGKVIVEQDDGADSLSPNQFYTKGDDPARYRFSVPADGTYKVMVSTREAAVQFGVRNQYVLRIAKENPDFRIAIMPFTPHLLDAGTLPKGGSTVFNVYVFRFDGFNDPIELSASNLPNGVTCPPQIVGAGQTRGVLVLTAEKDAEDWEGFVKIRAVSGKLENTARPFSLVWSASGLQPGQPPPNNPMITRMDRGVGMALAVRGEAPFTLTPSETKLTVKQGAKLDVTLAVERDAKFKDPILLMAASPGFGPQPKGNQPFPPVGTVPPNSNEIKLSLDVANNLSPGTHTLVLRGQSAAPPPKGGNIPLRAAPTYAAVPILVTVEEAPKKK